MKLIDSNSLVVLILGLMNPHLIKNHKRTSIYQEQDFYNLLAVIGELESLVVLPNIWTEVDNLLNGFNRDYKSIYVEKIISLIKKATEKYVESSQIEGKYSFYDLGITDTLSLEYAKYCYLLISSDSVLSDYAVSIGVEVYDMKKVINDRFRSK